jgi:pantothenate kinase
MDGFHLPQARLRALGTRDRMGAPETFDAAGYADLVDAVVASPGMPLTAPGFDRTVEEPVADGVRIDASARLVVTEGNYLLLPGGDWERARVRMAAVWQLRLADETRRERLLARHIAFGKSPAEALEWMTRVDEPNARLVQSYAARADLIIDVT